MTDIVPMYDHILIKLITPEEKSAGGIYINNPTLNKEYGEAEVIAIGEGYRFEDKIIPLKVEVGETVLYRKMAELLIDEENDIYIISESTVMAHKEV